MPCQKSLETKKVLKVGNSLMISITPYQAVELDVKAGDPVLVEVKEFWPNIKAVKITKAV